MNRESSWKGLSKYMNVIIHTILSSFSVEKITRLSLHKGAVARDFFVSVFPRISSSWAFSLEAETMFFFCICEDIEKRTIVRSA
jgi:hypothetical protein